MWAKDALKEIEDGNSTVGGHNSYGYHPVYLRKEQSNNFHIVYLRSSSALDFTIGQNYVNYKLVYFFIIYIFLFYTQFKIANIERKTNYHL